MTKKEILDLELQLAKENNITLKKIKFFTGHDQMTGLSCDLYIDGKKAAYCYDDARGGEMEIDPYINAYRQILIDLEEKLKVLPEYKYPNGNFMVKHSIENLINAIATDFEIKKEFNKDAKKGIMYLDPEGKEWLYKWSKNLVMYIAMRKDIAIKNIKDVVTELEKKGNVILNKDYLKKLGIDL